MGVVGLNSIFVNITLAGDLGNDRLVVEDSKSPLNKRATLTSGFLSGLLPSQSQEFAFSGFEVLDIFLSLWGNDFNVSSTPCSSRTSIRAAPSDDFINVTTTQGELNI